MFVAFLPLLLMVAMAITVICLVKHFLGKK